jgi:hypothetical protein
VDGNLTTYKARLVAKNFKHIQEVNYDDNFSSMAVFTLI